MITIIGLIAASLTTISFLPQAIRSIRTKNTKDISLTFTLIMFIGLSLWLVYGLLINDLPLIVANSISSALSLVIMVAKFKYD